MAIKLTKALAAYDRLDVTTVDCGNGWLWKIKSFTSIVKIFAREQARIKAAGGLKKAVAQTASVEMSAAEPLLNVDDPWLLGSYEADVEFFTENLSVEWEGLNDDDGNSVPYSKDNVLDILLENGKVGEQLYRELLAASLNAKLFLRTANAQAEVDGGN